MRRLAELCSLLAGPADRLLPTDIEAGSVDYELSTLTYDSRTCRDGCAFFAFDGIHTDGQRYIDQAIELGARLVVCPSEPATVTDGVQYLVTSHPRRMFARFSEAWFDHPSKAMRIVGVTGTDGKSSTCDFLWQMLESRGIRAGLLSTVAMDDGSTHGPSPYRQSTPEAFEIQAFLDRCRRNGLKTVILETTSHALSEQYDRLAGIEYACAVYTTISSEHLEFHKTLDAYVEAKLNLARRIADDGCLVLCDDNRYAARILGAAPEHATVVTCHIGSEEDQAQTAIRADILDKTLEGCSFVLRGTPGRIYRFPIGSPVFLSNAIEALTAASLLTGEPIETLAPAIEDIRPVPGRFNMIPNTLGFTVIVDFAHTADAFSRLMGELHAMAPSARLIAVFGAAGERDTSKRAPMGRQAATWCSVIYLTDEDPRNEPSQAIFDDLEAGIPASLASRREIHRIADRRQAIADALSEAREGDIVLFLGKGHERSIEYENGRKLPWDETQTIAQELARLTACKENCQL
ncbi:MAG: UDP-N-acetylmuramyl-tripeptide synthetase [Sphaerochaetaceae bacterium]